MRRTNGCAKKKNTNAMYFYNTPADQQAMLDTIGAKSTEELFESIPDEIRLQRPLNVGPSLPEIALTRHLQNLANQNQPADELICFLGGGSYDHFVPAVVDAIGSRSEFYTSYTPYQAEVSQGNLQVVFEYQSLIARLTGMDVSNASVYDGGSATAEAVLMALSLTKRYKKVVTASCVHPEHRQTVATYLANLGTEIETLGSPTGIVDAAHLSAVIDDETACVLVQQPNFFGCVQDFAELAEATHAAGALLVVIVDPISLGILARPGDYQADIVVAEGHSLGTPMSYGGPYLGIMACRQKFVRRLPGRIVGMTTDRHGHRSFALTLQTREQHIRREKATSNICTNQGLFALRAAVYLSQMGAAGMREVAEHCLHKSRYAAERIANGQRFSLAHSAPTFKEFVIRDSQDRVDELLSQARQAGFLAGIPLARWYPDLSDCFLVAVTEKRTRDEIDALVNVLHGNGTRATSANAPIPAALS